MPATSPQALARKAARKAERKKQRLAERRDDPVVSAYLGRQRAGHAKRLREKRDNLPFLGCDGEGAKDGNGRSYYTLFRMGERELCKDGARLSTPELLQFMVDAPEGNSDAIFVSFFFDYDASNILNDVSRDRLKPDVPSKLENLLGADLKAVKGAPVFKPYWTWLKFPGFPEFGVNYLPKNHLKVCLGEWRFDDKLGKRVHRAIEGSTRTIYDTAGFFQTSFLRALSQWAVGQEHLETIAAMKAARACFQGVSQDIRDYCKLECELLAVLMTRFREMCLAVGLRPRTWNGAGKLATSLLNQHGCMTAKELEEKLPPQLIDMAHAAFYGGRFEVTQIGKLPAVWEHDINSAYPAQMLKLPCLDHGVWKRASSRQLAELPSDALFVAPVRFHHREDQFLCGLPFRAKTGSLCWPHMGNGIYWSPEIRSAERLGATIKYKAGWRFEVRCNCQNFEWITPLYEQRRALGKDVRGYPLKLSYNALYGKMAQRIGQPRYANVVNAGLMTALTRAALNDAIVLAGDQSRVAMLATDAIYVTGGPIKGLDCGEALGQWGSKRYPSLFIVKPGLYWPPRSKDGQKLKTRGISPKFFEPKIKDFERAWFNYLPYSQDIFDERGEPPTVKVEVETFIGIRLALRLKEADKACQWIKRETKITFNWQDKRSGHWPSPKSKSLFLLAKIGDIDAHSSTYSRTGKPATNLDFERGEMEFEAMPEMIDLSPPFTE